jgi:hypothetical protein
MFRQQPASSRRASSVMFRRSDRAADSNGTVTVTVHQLTHAA